MENEKFKKLMKARGHWRDSTEGEGYIRMDENRRIDDSGRVELITRAEGCWVTGKSIVNSTSMQTNTNESGWFLLVDDSEGSALKLSHEDFNNIVMQKKPIIFIVGDGHRTPPFKYAEKIQSVIDAFDAEKLQLYVEFSHSDWLRYSTRMQYDALPSIFFEKRGFWQRRKKVLVTPWEPDISGVVAELYEMSVLCSSLIGDVRCKNMILSCKFKSLANACIHEFSLYSKGLSRAFENCFHSISDVGDNNAVESGLSELISILSGRWRDEYINPFLAKKISEHASMCPDCCFLVSVGDAHINWSNAPVQMHLAKIRGLTASFNHIVLFNERGE